MNSRDKYKYWLEAAEYDLESAKVMMNGGRYMYVAFMSQQAIEKLTKGSKFGQASQRPSGHMNKL